jgi:hypothetical protein
LTILDKLGTLIYGGFKIILLLVDNWKMGTGKLLINFAKLVDFLARIYPIRIIFKIALSSTILSIGKVGQFNDSFVDC